MSFNNPCYEVLMMKSGVCWDNWGNKKICGPVKDLLQPEAAHDLLWPTIKKNSRRLHVTKVLKNNLYSNTISNDQKVNSFTLNNKHATNIIRFIDSTRGELRGLQNKRKK